MTTLPPLPLVPTKDGKLAYLIDNSTLETLVCPTIYKNKHLYKRELSAARAGRNFGAGLHVGWKERYMLCGSKAVDPTNEQTINAALATYFGEKPQPDDDFRTLEHAQKVMKAYNKRYTNEDFTILSRTDGTPAVESSFAFPIGEVQGVQIIYTGRTDMFIHNSEGDWVLDHKTAFQYGENWLKQMAVDSGQKGYVWAFAQLYGRCPRGYIVDGVRIRRPTKKDEYAGVPPVDNTDFQRIPQYVFPQELDDWRENVLLQVDSIFYRHKRGSFEMNRRECVGKYGPCDFYDVCMAMPEQRESILASSMFEELTFSPLNKTGEQKKDQTE